MNISFDSEGGNTFHDIEKAKGSFSLGAIMITIMIVSVLHQLNGPLNVCER